MAFAQLSRDNKSEMECSVSSSTVAVFIPVRRWKCSLKPLSNRIQ